MSDNALLRAMMLLSGCAQYDARMWEKFEETALEPEAFFAEGRTLWARLGITERCMNAMDRMIANGWVERELDVCAQRGVRIVALRDAAYPEALRELADAPLLLYLQGGGVQKFLARQTAEQFEHSLGVVGTRRCSAYANAVAKELGRFAAVRGWFAVSGGAKGIDGASHAGCMEAGGMTAAVLGTGIDIVYPSEHAALFAKICEAGLLIAEYPLGTKGEAWRFPRRNRIIAGLSARTVVVEAPMKSGAMITARLAGELGRDVWAVPGRIGDERCAGSNRLIFDGALPLIDMETFFGVEEANGTWHQRQIFGEEDATERARAVASLNEAERELVRILTEQGNRTIDNLAEEAKMSAAEVFKNMTMLSMKGVVFQSGPGRYKLTD